jgi:WD40 repeat protein
MSRGRKRALAAILALCIGGAAAYLVLAALDPSPVTTDARPLAGSAPTELAGSSLMVRAVDRDDPRLNGRLFVIKGGRPRPLSGQELACERVYFAAGRGLCLATGETGVSYEATIFDSSLRPLKQLPLAGLPSRARVSSDGRYGSMTVFVNGHAYLGSGGFSTATTIVDMRSGEELVNLEDFAVSKDGRPFDAADFNFWGITFAADPNRFFATLRSGGHYYLVEGSLERRAMRVLRDGVECPSLSPDGTRIAFKSRIGEEDRWRLMVLDLDTLTAHPVAERRSIDDQAEWLDERTLVYSDGLDVYTVAADGGGVPRLVLRGATSPVSLAPGVGEQSKGKAQPRAVVED